MTSRTRWLSNNLVWQVIFQFVALSYLNFFSN